MLRSSIHGSTISASKIAAVAQLSSTSNKFSNLVDVAKCAAIARQQGASMLFLPECFGFIGSSASETLRNAEILDWESSEMMNSETVNAKLKSIVTSGSSTPDLVECEDDNESVFIMDGLRTIAQTSKLWISGGGIHEVITGEDRVYNTHVILNSEGKLVKKYRKIHLFDVSIPGSVELKESNTTRPGEFVEVCDSPLGVLGLTTCYDIRFPELYTELLNRGAQIMLAPSAFTIPTGTAHWHVLLRARAIETQTYVLAAAQVGRHNEKRESYGHSLAVSPWGDILADAKNDPGPAVVCCDIDVMTQVENIRKRMPIQEHRSAAMGYQ